MWAGVGMGARAGVGVGFVRRARLTSIVWRTIYSCACLHQVKALLMGSVKQSSALQCLSGGRVSGSGSVQVWLALLALRPCHTPNPPSALTNIPLCV